jgi:SLT domain-containing protein
MDLMTTKQAAEKWGVTVRRVQSLCEKGLIEGAEKLADMWVLPLDAEKPIDGRTLAARKSKNIKVDGGKSLARK